MDRLRSVFKLRKKNMYQKCTGDNNNHEKTSFRFKCRVRWTNICV